MKKNTNELENEFSLINEFKGYRNREDDTNLPEGFLIKGSQNVLTNVSGRVGSRKGYTLDGTTVGTANMGIMSAFDWKMSNGHERNLRAGFLTSDEDDGVLQYRYMPSEDPIDTGLRLPTEQGPESNWTNPTNAEVDDSSFATSQSAGLKQEYKTFGLGVGGTRIIPLPSKIYGIEVQIMCKSDVADSNLVVALSWDGGTTYTANKGGTPPQTTEAVVTYGGASDLWGRNWLDTECDDNFFFLRINANDLGTGGTVVSVDYIKVVIYYKYSVAADPTWRDLITALTSVAFNFTGEYWDATNLQSRLLFVNGAVSITEWTGGITTISGATANTITKQGEKTWAEEGFSPSGSIIVLIGGNEYTATGGHGTKTLTGVTPSPAAEAYGSIAHQKPVTTLNSAMADIPTAFKNDLISCLRNQVYVGSFDSNYVYISKVNDYKTYTFTPVTRVIAEGALLTLEGQPTAFIPQEDRMYISAGEDQWYQTKFTLSSDNTKEDFTIVPLKTSSKQAAKSQAMTVKSKNNVAFISEEPIINFLGRVENIFETPQITDISFPIVNDMNDYDWTDASLRFFKNFLYVAVPKESRLLIFNMTNPKNFYWEAPQIVSISRLSIIDGELYGHSYLTNETYKMFDGYDDNGILIEAIAKFSYNNHGSRIRTKIFDECFVEGYISSNAKLNLDIDYDIDGCMTETSREIDGSDRDIVCIGSDDNSIGKESLGKHPIGGKIGAVSTLPPKFRVIKTFTPVDFYEESISFRSSGKDLQWEILAFGPNVRFSTGNNNAIKQ
jgi:hypothetical protein